MCTQTLAMKAITSLSLFALVHTVAGHGDHGGGIKKGETIQQYARRHMSSEHHIDDFDVRSFFSLHDLNRDGSWDRAEIEAVYGMHHIYAQRLSKDDVEHKERANHVVNTVLEKIDANRDGKITPEELEQAGLDALPNFEGIGADGHHYDVESEFFLHHEEEFHSTPETQTDEAYVHPEDLEHFAHHEKIERVEAEKEALFQGVSVEEILAQQEEHDHEHEGGATEVEGGRQAQQGGDQQLLGDAEPVPHPHEDQQQEQQAPGSPPKPKITRAVPPEKQDPAVRFRDAASEGKRRSEWGTGEEGYKAPKAPADKMRKSVPYKYKFRRNWGDF